MNSNVNGGGRWRARCCQTTLCIVMIIIGAKLHLFQALVQSPGDFVHMATSIDIKVARQAHRNDSGRPIGRIFHRRIQNDRNQRFARPNSVMELIVAIVVPSYAVGCAIHLSAVFTSQEYDHCGRVVDAVRNGRVHIPEEIGFINPDTPSQPLHCFRDANHSLVGCIRSGPRVG